MTPRALRRAQERKAKKLSLKAARQMNHETPETDGAQTLLPAASNPHPSGAIDFSPEAQADISEARLAANRRNALFSTGPASAIGKATSCLNALKTGLTGQTVLLPSEDAAEYRAHLADYETALAPVGRLERDLVQSLGDTRWRLNRIPRLEMAIYAQGRIEFGESFNQHPAEYRASMIEMQTFIAYEKQLKNLQLQEARLHRRYEKDLKALRELQNQRKADQAAAASERPQSLTRNGFEFSTNANQASTNLQAASLSDPLASPNGFEFSTDPSDRIAEAA